MNFKNKKKSDLRDVGRNGPPELFIVLASLLAFALGLIATRTDIVDPDGPYHLMISRLMLKGGVLRSIPQLDNMDWGTKFVDKEFLFHVLTSLFYAMGGEVGVKILTVCLDLGIAALLYGFIKRLKIPSWTRLLLLCVFFAQATYMFRISATRPHVLAILLYLLNLQSILSRDKRTILITSYLLPLAYHVLYLVPLNLAFAFLFLPERRKYLGWGGVAFVLGVLSHPYFPGNITIFITQMESGLALKEIPAWLRPAEFSLPALSVSWQIHACFATMVAVVIWLRGALRRLPWSASGEFYFLGGLTLVWYGMMLVNFRALEYAFPVWFLGFSTLVALCPRERPLFLLLLTALLLSEILVTLENKPRQGFQSITRFLATNEEVIGHIPADASGKKVFNCFWNQGNQLFFHRPDMKLVDLLDPIFLFKHDRRLFDLRESLSEANEMDPYHVVAGEFKSSYVLCEFGNLNMQLELDPRFRRITPQSLGLTVRLKDRFVDSTSLTLFAVEPAGQKAFVTALKRANGPHIGEIISVGPDEVVFDIQSAKGSDIGATDSCTILAVTDEQIRAHAGAVFVGLGGSVRAEASLNGILQPKGQSAAPQVQAMIGELLPLQQEIRAGDLLTFKFCGEAQKNMSLVVSLWTPDDIAYQCKAKSNLNEMLQDVDFSRVIQGKFQHSSVNICAHALHVCAEHQGSWCAAAGVQ